MTIGDALSRVTTIKVELGSLSEEDLPPVFRTVADELARATGASVTIESIPEPTRPQKGVFHLLQGLNGMTRESGTLGLKEDGSGYLAVTPLHLLFPFVTHLLRDRFHDDVSAVAKGAGFPTAFSWQRSTFDFFLTQEGRIQKGLDRERYVRRLAESGFTHMEVNGLAFPAPIETGPPEETYAMFYTYCPALDQFVESDLGAGLYPEDYLSANLDYLKTNAELARKYGLVPGLLCFEPRSVPEEFFQRYPMLRGARVDHPFRSFKPRYNMTIAHPLVREHYGQMVGKLLDEVPELGFLSVWTNDSGAGFEHTQSLYVGRNGGAYLIREWKNEEEIAKAAGGNALRFLRALRDAGRAKNPEFRVLTRMESFYGEHDVIWAGLEDGLEVETASLITRGWEMPYSHPRYPDSRSFPAGSVYQQSFSPGEEELASELAARSSAAHFYSSVGPHWLFAPLVGVPYPSLTLQRLRLLHRNGVKHLAQMGGTHPPGMVPFSVNHEILRAFQFDPGLDLARTLRRIATSWAGEGLAPTLERAWELTEEAILAFPHTTALYSMYGFVWYRLWARPLVPNIEAIPSEERAYYEDFMCTTPHNPNNVDLSRDVLFQLTTVEESRKALARMDDHVWGPLDEALGLLSGAREEASGSLGVGNVIQDQFVRLSALRCWLMTQRNVAAWVAGVCGYMEADSDSEKEELRGLVRDLISMELENSRKLLGLLDAGIGFMATTDQGETPLIHGENLRELLTKRMALMSAHREDEPFIDPDYMERNAGRETMA
jgi:hypothetical protein